MLRCLRFNRALLHQGSDIANAKIYQLSKTIRWKSTRFQLATLRLTYYSAFQIDRLHRHNQNLVETFHRTSLLWSTEMKTTVIWDIVVFLKECYANIDFTFQVCRYIKQGNSWQNQKIPFIAM